LPHTVPSVADAFQYLEKRNAALTNGDGHTMGANIPLKGFLRLPQIIGDRKNNIPAIIPVSRTTWWRGVRDGIYPQPHKLSAQAVGWKAEDIMRLVDSGLQTTAEAGKQ
jgi:prophage regulatory protein